MITSRQQYDSLTIGLGLSVRVGAVPSVAPLPIASRHDGLKMIRTSSPARDAPGIGAVVPAGSLAPG